MIDIRPTCRNRFTPADFDFISRVLGSDSSQQESLNKLFQDPGTLDLILDHEKLFQALLEGEGLLNVSPQFYFYVLVRHILVRAGFDDRELADYVGSILATFSSSRKMRTQVHGMDGALDYLVDILQAIQGADDSTRFSLTLHLGNYALFLSGIFPDYIEHRARRKAAPGLAYYEALGSSHFDAAGNHRLAIEYNLAPILATLAERFTSTRVALNDLSERLLIWRDINPHE